MIPKLIILFALLLSTVTKSFAQTNVPRENKYSALKIGDTMPNYTFKNLINYPKDEISVSDFKGKLLIIDFWSTYCGTCVDSWPKLLKLQEKYKANIQILLVNPTQDASIAQPIFKKRSEILKMPLTNLPSVCLDTVIKQLFPYQTVPHVIWIDHKGVVQHITYGDGINENNIESMIKGEKIKLPLKNDFYELPFDFAKPVFTNGNAGDGENLLWSSMLSKRVDGVPYMLGIVLDSLQASYIIGSNAALKDLYQIAFTDFYWQGLIMPIPTSQISLNMQDTTNFVFRINGEQQQLNQYIYQAYSSVPVSKLIMQRKMQEDLKSLFGYDASWQKIKKKCLVLKAIDTSILSQKHSGKPNILLSDLSLKLINYEIKHFVESLQNQGPYANSDYPIIDETKYLGKIGYIDIQNINLRDHNAFHEALQKFGLGLYLEERVANVLVISDSESNDRPARILRENDR